MELNFENSDLEGLSLRAVNETELPPLVIAIFRRKLQMLLAASSKDTFKNLKSMQIIPRKEKKDNTYFVALIDGWNLILSFPKDDEVKIIDINKN